MQHSGIARGLRASTFRPALRQQALKKSFVPAISQRFASSDSARDGKVHQVIGAVVDGMGAPPGWKSFAELVPSLTLDYSQVPYRCAPTDS